MHIKFFKKEKSFKKKSFSPILYWKIVVCAFFVLSVFSISFGFFLFKQVNKKPIFSGENNTSRAKMVKPERINKVLQYFSEREKKSKQIINSPSPISDPSN